MENIQETIDDLIDHIDSGNNVEAEKVFNTLLQHRVDEILNVAKVEVAHKMFNTEECADCEEQNEEVEVANEALKGGQHKIDANKNGKIDAQDFKMLRAKKDMKEEEIVEYQRGLWHPPAEFKKSGIAKGKGVVTTPAYKKSKKTDTTMAMKGKMKEEVESVEENKYSLPAGSTMNPNKKYEKPKSSLEKRFGHLKPGESASMKGDPKKVMKKEEVEIEEASYSAKMARAGKDIGKPGKMFAKIAAKAARKYGKERGAKIAGAVLAKLRKKGK